MTSPVGEANPAGASPEPSPAPAPAPSSPTAAPLREPLLVRLRRRLVEQPFSVWVTLAVCVVLVALFGKLSAGAAAGKSATYDEPLHVVGGFVHRFFKDYRINPEDPALFGLWASLSFDWTSILVDVDSPAYEASVADVTNQWPFVVGTLFQTRAIDGDAAVEASRRMFVLVGMLLVALVAWWGWKLAGPVGAVAPTILLALDPNFLAHAALVKNDVPMALMMLALGYVTWQLGRPERQAWWRLILLAALVGAGINVKFSGFLLAPMLALLLVVRATFPSSLGGGTWRLLHLDLDTIGKRLLAGVAICVGVGLCAWLMTWAVYGFRFAATRDGRLLNTAMMMDVARVKEAQADVARRGEMRQLTAKDLEGRTVGLTPQLVKWAEDNHLLPQAWLFGFLYTYATTRIRSAFLLGQSNIVGWWYYFPLAMLFKTPIATLIAIAGALVIGFGQYLVPPVYRWLNRNDASRGFPVTVGASEVGDSSESSTQPRPTIGTALPPAPRTDPWTIACLLLPPAVYAVVALTTNLNLGLRHVLPLYPYIYLAIGVIAAKLARVLPPRIARVAGGAIVLLLAVESFAAYPNYLAYFNYFSRPPRDQVNTKLGDSNLDWGQDLKLLAKWQSEHTDKPMYVAYFGSADYASYGVNAGNVIPSRYPFRPGSPAPPVGTPVYLAISATELQGVYSQDDFKFIREKFKPVAVLGDGTIFIYAWTQGQGKQ